MKGAGGDLARESWHNAYFAPIFHHLFYLSHFRWISKSFAHNRQELWTKFAHNRQELRAKIAHNRQESVYARLLRRDKQWLMVD